VVGKFEITIQYWGEGGNLVAGEGAAAIELRGRDWALLKK